MSFFDSHPSTLAPADVLEALLDAAARRDAQALRLLCERHQDEIRSSFPTWRTVPEPVRADQARLARYGEGLIAVAQLFKEAGDPSLFTLLTGNQGDNPLVTFQRDLAKGQTLLDKGQPAAAAQLLAKTLETAAGLRGSGVHHYLPRILGMLGVARFRAGDEPGALDATRKARDLCAAAGDTEGVAVYSKNLAHIESKDSPGTEKSSTFVLQDPNGQQITVEVIGEVPDRRR